VLHYCNTNVSLLHICIWFFFICSELIWWRIHHAMWFRVEAIKIIRTKSSITLCT